MSDFMPQARLPLPDDWEPEGIVCAVVPIPDDPEYLAALTGLIDDLRYSRTFQRDDTHTGGATVSRIWERALDSRPIIKKSCEEIDMLFDLRIKPDDPTITQASTDGGETWHDAINTCSCGDEPRFAPVPEDEAEAGAIAGGMIRGFMEHVASHINTCITDSVAKTTCIDTLMDELIPYGAGAAVRGSLSHVFDQLEASPDAADWETDCPYVDCYQPLADYIFANPTTWLDGLSDFLFDWLDCSSDALTTTLNQAAVQLGLGFFDTWWAGGGTMATDFADDCTWEHIFDFTTGMHGWEFTIPCDSEAGTLTGAGLTSAYVHVEPCPTNQSVIIAHFRQHVNLTYARIEGNNAGASTGRVSIATDLNSSDRGTSEYLFYSSVAAGDFEFEASVTYATNGIELYLDWGATGGVQDGSYATLTLRGTGIDPYS